jgi:hypothetical protein
LRPVPPREWNNPGCFSGFVANEGAGASEEMCRRDLARQAAFGQSAGGRDIRRGFGIVGQSLGHSVMLVGIEPAIGKAGEVEKALGFVLGNLGRAASPPELTLGGPEARLSGATLIVYSGHDRSTTLVGKISPQLRVS